MLGNVILFGCLAAVATILGMLLVIAFGKRVNKYLTHIIGFGAGVLVSAALIHLMPEAIELHDYALIFVLIGFVIFYILEHFVMLHACHEKDCKKHAVGKVAFVGLTFHSLIDGIIIGIGFEVNFVIGLVAALAVLLHEFPEGIASISIMLHSGMKKKKAILNSIIIAIATPIGAIGSYLLFKNLGLGVLGILLALAAGGFLYIGASDLIPEVHKNGNRLSIVFFIIGILLIFALRFL